jgi:hypothetical protein
MATTRTTVDAVKREARTAFLDGRAMGMSVAESVERAARLTGNGERAIREWLGLPEPL